MPVFKTSRYFDPEKDSSDVCAMTDLGGVEGCPFSVEGHPGKPLERVMGTSQQFFCLLPEVFACNRGWQTLSNIARLHTKKKKPNKPLILSHAPESVVVLPRIDPEL